MQRSLSDTDTVVFCPLCGSQNLLIIQEPQERLIFVTDGDEMKVLIGVRGCGDCGFIFLSPRMAAPTLIDYYSRQSRMPRATIPSNSPLMQLMDIQIDFLERHFPLRQGAAVLEVGCAEGFFLARIVERKSGNIQVSGIEPSRRYVEYARSLIPRGRFYEDLLEEVEFGNERFDLVIMRHVFEHLLSPIRTLEIVSGVLKPTGAMFVEVPDAAIPVAGAFHFFHHEHLSYFTKETLTATVARAGFKPLCVEQFQTNPANSGFDYPVLRAIAKPDRNAHVEKHPDQPRAIWEIHRRIYEEFWELRLLPLVRRLKDLYRMRKRLAIFGAGPHTMDLLEWLSLPTTFWTVILDNNPAKQGKRLCGIPVDLPTSEQLSALDVILVSSAAFEGEIVEQLKEIAPKKVEILTIYS